MFEYILTADFIFSVIRLSTPILFAAMAAVIGAKADVLCIAYEAMMLLAALGGVIGSAYSQNLIVGMLVGIASGLLIAGIFAYFVLYLDTTPLLAGLALNIFGAGLTVYIVFLLTGRKLDTSVLPSLKFPDVHLPLIEDIPFIGDVISGHNILSYFAILTVFLVYYFIFKTKLGLQIRAAGENPEAATSAGIDVKRTKLIALLISGVIASFGGLFLSMSQMPYFTTNMTAGRGFIGIAAQNLSGGSPIGTTIATLVFGATMSVGNIAQTFRLPSQFASMAPYLMTIIGTVVVGMKARRDEKKIKHL